MVKSCTVFLGSHQFDKVIIWIMNDVSQTLTDVHFVFVYPIAKER